MTPDRVLRLDGAASVPPRAHCCARMTGQVNLACALHPDPFDCGDRVVWWSPRFDEYGLIVHDGSGSYLLIERCPWCGAALPASRRGAWFDAVEAAGLDPFGDDLPAPLRGDGWYRGRAG